MTVVLDRYGPVLAAAVASAVVAAVIGRASYRRRVVGGEDRRDAARRTLAEAGIVVGTWPWLWMILTPADGERAVRPVPLVDLADVAGSAPSVVVVQVVGNLLVFAAWGFFGPMRFRVGPVGVAVTAAVASIVVEAAQYVLDIGRVSSVDDVWLNVLGAIGFCGILAATPLETARGRGRVRGASVSG